MPDTSCPRCGATVSPGHQACGACGIGVSPVVVQPITVGSQQALRPQRWDPRLSRLRTLEEGDAIVPVPQVRRRQLAPPAPEGGADYTLGAVIGEGGMGVVWSASQAGLGREVAIKRVRPGASRRAREQLLAEAALTGALEHPGIVPVHEAGIDQDGVPFYAMRRMRGRTWLDRWEDLTQRQHLETLLRVGDAIAYAHGQGVIHRDIKPGNVFLGEYGEVVVFDWGLAAYIDQVRQPGRRLFASGTPAYMAPEMARADAAKLGAASDIYLLGATLYEILTGSPPHPGETDAEILTHAADNRIYPPIPDGELGAIARKAMAAEPEDRYADVRAFQAALRTCFEHQESLSLSTRARARLVEAETQAGYDAFARAVHAFEDAIDLWPGNSTAIAGLAEARLRYAERARRAGDLDLATGLLSPTQPSHVPELALISSARRQAVRRRQAFRWLSWTMAGLVAALCVVLMIAFLAVSRQRDLVVQVSRERDAAEAALVHSQAGDGVGRMWRRLVQEDFAMSRLPMGSRILEGRFHVSGGVLVAEGTTPSVLHLQIPPTVEVLIQIDIENGGRLACVLGGNEADLAKGRAGDGLLMVFDRQLTVSRSGVVLAKAALPDEIDGLARRLRVDRNAQGLRIVVDGKPVIERLPTPGSIGSQLGLIVDPGTILDNFKVEIPWE